MTEMEVLRYIQENMQFTNNNGEIVNVSVSRTNIASSGLSINDENIPKKETERVPSFWSCRTAKSGELPARSKKYGTIIKWFVLVVNLVVLVFMVANMSANINGLIEDDSDDLIFTKNGGLKLFFLSFVMLIIDTIYIMCFVGI
jgi:hypothetical protein